MPHEGYVVVLLFRLLDLPLTILIWELAWRDYGVKAALGTFFAYGALATLFYGPHFFRSPQAIHLMLVLILAHATGGLTRRLFGAGKKYSHGLPTLTG